ncbi:MAG TPA: serine/threonine-protein kinase [Candidatus Limnocylindria bacterium]|nr:serine/threonine-protein kinase [Candidatus Limnocylindria bacterium]
MNWLSDEAISRLQAASALPELTGTRYRIIQRIGSGGMGAVYLAEDAVLERRVALKILDFPDASGELAVRLLREAHILARLEHPGIVPVHDAGALADGRVFYAMKFVEGERLDRLAVSTGALSDRLRVFQRICDAVAFAHARGILHRDLKPDNIMIGPFGEVLVMDWGIAKIMRQPAESAIESGRTARGTLAPSGVKTGHGTILGTPGYMAPEQERGEVEDLDERADIYSLGAILQFLLMGCATAARPVEAVARKAMAANPADRYGSVGQLGEDIARYLDELPVSAFPENIVRKLSRWGARYQLAIVLVLTYLVMRAILLIWLRR